MAQSESRKKCRLDGTLGGVLDGVLDGGKALPHRLSGSQPQTSNNGTTTTGTTIAGVSSNMRRSF